MVLPVLPNLACQYANVTTIKYYWTKTNSTLSFAGNNSIGHSPMKTSLRCNLCKHNLKNQPNIEKALISWLTEFNHPLYCRHEIQHFICQQIHCGLDANGMKAPSRLIMAAATPTNLRFMVLLLLMVISIAAPACRGKYLAG